jgi:hypothetical protein
MVYPLLDGQFRDQVQRVIRSPTRGGCCHVDESFLDKAGERAFEGAAIESAGCAE